MPVFVLLDDVLLFDDLVAGLLDVSCAIRPNVDVRHFVERLLASHRALLDDLFLFHGCPLRFVQ